MTLAPSTAALAAPALLVALAAACGNTATGSGGSGGASPASSSSSSSAASSSSGTGGSRPFGDCATDADCAGAPCVAITDGGYRTCLVHVEPVTSCGPGQMGCCDSDTCFEGAQCYPPFGYCGGLVGPQNKCLADACQVDADCGAGHVCAQAGVLAYPVRTCMEAHCARDADCGAKAGGRCGPVEDTCCAGVFALYCVYPDGCRTNADCPAAAPVCAGDPATGAARCVTKNDAPTCPI